MPSPHRSRNAAQELKPTWGGVQDPRTPHSLLPPPAQRSHCPSPSKAAGEKQPRDNDLEVSPSRNDTW